MVFCVDVRTRLEQDLHYLRCVQTVIPRPTAQSFALSRSQVQRRPSWMFWIIFLRINRVPIGKIAMAFLTGARAVSAPPLAPPTTNKRKTLPTSFLKPCARPPTPRPGTYFGF